MEKGGQIDDGDMATWRWQADSKGVNKPIARKYPSCVASSLVCLVCAAEAEVEGCRLLENFLWTRVDGRLHMVAENVDMHIRCHDTRDTSTICRIRLCAFAQRVEIDQG